MKEFPFDPYDVFGYLAAGFVILVGLEITIGVPSIIGKDLGAFDILIVTLAAYIAGQMTATPAQWLLEDLLVSALLKRPVVNLMRTKDKRPWLRFIFPGYYEPLPPEVQSRIIRNAQREQLTDTRGESLFVHIRFRDYVRSDINLMARLSAFLNKYGFNRNLCFVAILFALAVLSLTPFDPSRETTRYGLLALTAAVLLFYRYLKFFRQYSYDLLNSYAGKSVQRKEKPSSKT